MVVGSKIYGECYDRRLHYPGSIGLDMLAGDGVDLVHDLEKPLSNYESYFSHVDCCSVLEHVRKPWKFAANLVAAMQPGATLLVCAPFIWRYHAYPNDYWRYTPEALDVLFDGIHWREKLFFSNGEFVQKPPSFNDFHGWKWMGRTEIAAFGVKA